MSNNKQSMKLYTEEQVLKMLEVCRDTDLYEHILTFEDILKTETPIELPSELTALNEHLEWLKKELQRVIDEGYSESWIYAYQLAIKNAESTIKKNTHENNNRI